MKKVFMRKVFAGAVLAVAAVGFAATPSPVRATPYEVSGLGVDDPDHGFPYSPVDSDVHVYVLSGGLASDPVPHAQGNDNNPGTKARPLLTIDGVRRLIGRRGIEGKRIIVHMGGGGYVDGISGVTDPWDGQCTSMRQYPVRQIYVGGSEAYVNSWQYRGPPLGVLFSIQPDIGNLEPDPATNGRTRWRLYNAASYTTNSLKGYYLRIKRGALLVSNELQITGNDATYLYTDHGNYSNGGGTYSTSTDTFQIVYRAAEFIPTSRPGGVDLGVGGADGISIQGWGAANPYGRLVNGANPALSFEWVGFENLNLRGVSGVSFDRCFFYHSARFFDSSLSFRGCAIDAQIPTIFRNCQVNVEDGALYSEVQEYNGRAAVEGGPSNPAGNPVHPDVGGQSIYAYSLSFAGGLQIRGGQFHTRKGLSVEGGIIVRDEGKLIMPAPGQAHSVHIRDCTGVGTAALMVRDDSVAIIEKNNVSFVNVTNHLKVGVGAAIDLGTGAGQFSQVAGWNGNFDRRLEVNGSGKPSGDLSAIRDSATWGAP